MAVHSASTIMWGYHWREYSENSGRKLRKGPVGWQRFGGNGEETRALRYRRRSTRSHSNLYEDRGNQNSGATSNCWLLQAPSSCSSIVLAHLELTANRSEPSFTFFYPMSFFPDSTGADVSGSTFNNVGGNQITYIHGNKAGEKMHPLML